MVDVVLVVPIVEEDLVILVAVVMAVVDLLLVVVITVVPMVVPTVVVMAVVTTMFTTMMTTTQLSFFSVPLSIIIITLASPFVLMAHMIMLRLLSLLMSIMIDITFPSRAMIIII